jgi:F0F1-type ATP synthase alpha subunit
VHAKHPGLLDGIRTQKALSSELESELKGALESFSKTFA